MPQIDYGTPGPPSLASSNSWKPSRNRLLLLIPAAALCALPILVDSVTLNCSILPNPDCFNNPNPAFYLKIASAGLGSSILALALVPMPRQSFMRWFIRVWIVIAASIMVLIGAFYADFAREFTF